MSPPTSADLAVGCQTTNDSSLNRGAPEPYVGGSWRSTGWQLSKLIRDRSAEHHDDARGYLRSAWAGAIDAIRVTVRRPLHHALRAFHWRFCQKSLPQKLGLYFHTLDPGQEQVFAKVITWLKEQGYAFALPGDFLHGTGRTAYISFDDNHQSWHGALPLLSELGIACTFFVNTCVLRGETSDAQWQSYCHRVRYHGGGQPLSRSEIREISAAGHRIGAHTHGHISLRKFSPEQVESDLRQNRDMLEEITGQPVADFAFPFGMPRHFPPRHRPVVQRLGFKTVSHATPGMQFVQGDLQALHRTQWNYLLTAAQNEANLRVDGRHYVRWTGFSPVG